MNMIRRMSMWLLFAAAAMFYGCVDETFRIDQVSTEISIAQESVTLPLGRLKEMTIADMLGDTEVNGLTKDENGDFMYAYSGKGKPNTIDGIEDSFTVPGTENLFTVDYPSFNLNMSEIVIDEKGDVAVNKDELTDVLPISNGELPEELVPLMPRVKGSFNKTFEGDDMHLILDLPEQVDNIRDIVFKNVESGHHGAPMHLTVDFNGLAGINGGGHIDFKLNISGGEFRIVDENNELIYEGSEFHNDYEVAPGVESVDFVIYVESIANHTLLNSVHQLDIPLALTCDMTFDLEAEAGMYNLDDMPHFALFADFEYGDAEIVMNENISLVEYHPEEPTNIYVRNLPAELKSINAMEFADGMALNLYAHGLEWLGESAEMVVVEVDVPQYLVLHAVEGAGYEYDEAAHKLITTIADINDGVILNVEGVDFGAESIAPDAEGSICLDMSFDINAHFKDSDAIKVSSLIHDEALTITMGIEDMDLALKSVSGAVDYTYTLEQEFKLIDDSWNIGDIEIEGIGLSPVITINIDNPLTLPLSVEAELSDDTGRSIRLGDISLAAATYDHGSIIPAQNRIVIANERPDYDCIYVETDFDELFAGALPSLLSVALDVSVDADTTHTLYVDDEFVINYDYAIDLPLELNDKMKLIYSDAFDGMSDIFSQIAEYDVHAGDVTIIANVSNTTPLAFEAEVTLLDAEGEAVDLRVEFEEGCNHVCGSADGTTAATSDLRLNIANGDGEGLSLVRLAEVDGIAVRLVAMSDAKGDVALNADQSISAMLQLELAGGVTIDLDDFLNL